MFFSDKIINITDKCKVLEVGPGGNPHPRADVLLEKIFKEKKIASAQRGYAPNMITNKPIIYYDGKAFPFEDKEFDYVICTHVLEHVPIIELENFISEIHRVSKAGFIEFPTIFYELINHQDVHLWYMNYRDNTILFLDKNVFTSNYIHKIFREMFYAKDDYMRKAFSKYRELFFNSFEWQGSFKYKIVNDYTELINEQDFIVKREYFTNIKKEKNFWLSLIVLLRKILHILVSKIKKENN
jgi:ubiquinone/menaquinone biosynthesis C-methylase UbiE